MGGDRLEEISIPRVAKKKEKEFLLLFQRKDNTNKNIRGKKELRKEDCKADGRKRPDCPANRDVACSVTVSPSNIETSLRKRHNKKKYVKSEKVIFIYMKKREVKLIRSIKKN